MTTAAAPGSNGCPHDPRAAASYYRARGFIPIPVPLRSKKPILEGWPDLRPDEADLGQLFPAGVELNLGLLLGEPSGGLLDIDLDCDEAIAAAPHLLPPTGMISGRKGRLRSHYWYTADDPPDAAQEKFTDLAGGVLVEMRSSGGQTIAPPSVHETGCRIGWHECGEPGKVKADDLRRAVTRVAAAALIGRHWPAKGSRQDAALALAGALLRGSWSTDDATAFLHAVASAAGDDEPQKRLDAVAATDEKLTARENVTGWPTLEGLLTGDGTAVGARVRKWLAAGAKRGRDVGGQAAKKPAPPPAPYQPFPTEALPEPITSFVKQGAAALGCDPAYLALPALSLAASLIGNTREIRLKRDWHEPSVLWSAIIGDSGTLKSPAQKLATGFAYRLQKEMLAEFQADMQEYQKARDEYDQRARQAKKDGKALDTEPPEKPTLPRLITGDVTIEKLAQLLEDNPRGLLLCRDELGGWLASFQRYKGKAGGSDLPGWLEMHRAETLVVDRKTGDRPTLFIPRAAVSVTGGIQPGTLARALTPEYFEAGMAARLLMAMPPKRAKRWTEDEVHPDVRQAYETMLRRLADVQLDRDDAGEKVPFTVKLTPEAKAAWVAFYQEWAGRQAGADGEQAACLSKLEGVAARLALLHHVVTHAADLTDCDPVQAKSIQAGATLARWFAYEAGRIYSALRESDEARQTRRLLEFIRSHGGTLTARRLRLSNTSRYPTPESAEAGLDALVVAGLAEWVDNPPGPKGGRPTRATPST